MFESGDFDTNQSYLNREGACSSTLVGSMSRNQPPTCLAFTCTCLDGTRPAIFPLLLFYCTLPMGSFKRKIVAQF